jgi:hypothetical protein
VFATIVAWLWGQPAFVPEQALAHAA